MHSRGGQWFVVAVGPVQGRGLGPVREGELPVGTVSSDQVLEKLLGIVDGRDGARGPADQGGEGGSQGKGNSAAEVEPVGLEHEVRLPGRAAGMDERCDGG